MSVKTLFATLALGASLCLPAQAPPPPSPDGPPPDAPGEEAPDGGQRREMMRLMVVSRMRERLALSEAQTVKVMTLLEEMEKQQLRHHEEDQPLLEKLRALVGDPATPDAAFREAVAALNAKRGDHEKENQSREEALLAVFTPRQQAQWFLLRRELLGRLRDGFEPGRPGPRGENRPQRKPHGAP